MQKQKIYVICPSIEESKMEINNVKKTCEYLKKEFPRFNVALLHGKLSNDEKNNIFNDFEIGNIQILVSTTVIEVGIDIKDANMIIIFNAERFGMAQLHQLRGRIARDGKIGYCYLLSVSDDEDTINRLNFIASTNDGFKISEYDLMQRGSGDMLGYMQSGKSPFVIASLINDFNILKQATIDAKEIIASNIEYPILNEARKKIKENNKHID